MIHMIQVRATCYNSKFLAALPFELAGQPILGTQSKCNIQVTTVKLFQVSQGTLWLTCQNRRMNNWMGWVLTTRTGIQSQAQRFTARQANHYIKEVIRWDVAILFKHHIQVAKHYYTGYMHACICGTQSRVWNLNDSRMKYCFKLVKIIYWFGNTEDN